MRMRPSAYLFPDRSQEAPLHGVQRAGYAASRPRPGGGSLGGTRESPSAPAHPPESTWWLLNTVCGIRRKPALLRQRRRDRAFGPTLRALRSPAWLTPGTWRRTRTVRSTPWRSCRTMLEATAKQETKSQADGLVLQVRDLTVPLSNPARAGESG